ncbi:hypothetical protein Scep_025993 [Stephania cephalantha]|uniref:Uncharacterized protein n=1 Tax=Stephania cephalantha TaxID=152367 RepID=A0AAP0ET64_9MAGN
MRTRGTARAAFGDSRRRRWRDGGAGERQRGNGRMAMTNRQCDATQRGGTHQWWRAGAGERWRGCDAMNGAVARCRPIGCAISTKSRRRDGAIVEIVVEAGRQGPRPKSDVFHGRPSILSGSMDGS